MPLPPELLQACREARLLVVWARLPFALAERSPENRVAAISAWAAQAAQLPPTGARLPALPPLSILSLDASDRVERAFEAAGVALHVVRTRQEVPARNTHSLLKLAGDLRARSGVVLSRAEIHDLHDDDDKRHLLAEARRVCQNGAILIIGGDPVNEDFKAWWSALARAFEGVACFAVGDPSAPWPAGVTCIGSDFDEVSAALRNARPGPSTQAPSEAQAGRDAVSLSGSGGIATSGGVAAGAGGVAIGGDVHGDVIIQAGHDRAGQAQPTGGAAEVDSLRRQLDELRANLRLIEERKAEYVESTGIPLQLVKEERQLRERIAQLERRISEMERRPPPEADPPAPPASPRRFTRRLNRPQAWFLLGFILSGLFLVMAFQGLRCLIEYRITEAAIALIALLAAGVATAFTKLLSPDVRKNLLSLYAGIGVVLIVGIILAVASPPLSREECIPEPPPPPPSPTPTITLAPTPTPTSTPTPTDSPTPTSTPTPTPVPPETAIAHLIQRESEAVLAGDMDIIRAIFAPDAVRINGPNGEAKNAIADYEEISRTLRFLEVQHSNIVITIEGDTATAMGDSCGSYRVKSTGQGFDFHGPQSDRWEFSKPIDDMWIITSLQFNLVSDAPEHRYFFEDGTNGCWAVRYDRGAPQGETPIYTTTRAYNGSGSLQFSFDTSQTSAHHGQAIVYNMPFVGQASAFVYAPPDAPADLQAGFFAMDFDRPPYNYHPVSQSSRLAPGRWTQVTWSPNVTGWARTLHLIGIEVSRASGSDYRGYVLIDEVYFKSR